MTYLCQLSSIASRHSLRTTTLPLEIFVSTGQFLRIYSRLRLSKIEPLGSCTARLFLQTGCPSSRPTSCIKAIKQELFNNENQVIYFHSQGRFNCGGFAPSAPLSPSPFYPFSETELHIGLHVKSEWTTYVWNNIK